MRIGIVAPMFPPLKSGSSHYAHRIAEGLGKRGHDVFVITSKEADVGNGSHYRIIPTPSMKLPSTPLTHNYSLPYNFFPLNYPLLKRTLSQQEPDVIHVNGHFLDLNLMGVKAASSLHIPSVVTIHTRLVHANPRLNPFFRAVDRSLMKYLLSKASSIIALDRQMYRYIEDTYQVPSDRIATIPLGLDIADLTDKLMESSLIDSLSGSRVIVSLTHITALKTPRTLLYAFAKVKETISDLKLVLIGEVRDSRVRSWIEKLNLHDDVVLLGPVQHDAIPSILKRSYLEAHALDFRTGFDNASIEAMALGLPVVSCVREDNFGRPWLKNWENVVLVKPRDIDMTAEALRQLLENDALYKSISENAGSSAQKYFSLARMLDDIEALYEALV